MIRRDFYQWSTSVSHFINENFITNFITCFLVSLQLPELMHSETLQSEPLVTFLMQNFGLLLGFAIMLIIALHEEDLKVMKF